jgi:hypothetical protein
MNLPSHSRSSFAFHRFMSHHICSRLFVLYDVISHVSEGEGKANLVFLRSLLRVQCCLQHEQQYHPLTFLHVEQPEMLLSVFLTHNFLFHISFITTFRMMSTPMD